MSKQQSKEKVTVFGEEWDSNQEHSHGDSVFGAMLLIGGILLLLNTFTVLPWSVWNYVWPFWPIIIILWGIQLIVGFSRFSRFMLDLLGILAFVLVALFAVHQVKPEFLAGLPVFFEQLFTIMENI